MTLLSLAGCLIGALNTLAGGGSLLAIPILMLLGLPPIAAAATSRPAIVLQNLVAIASFRRRGAYSLGIGRRAVLLGLATVPGALLGAWLLAEHTQGETFQRILAVVMIAVAVATWRRRRTPESPPVALPAWVVLGFFALVGLYGGFLQAGVGFIIMAVLLHGGVRTVASVNAMKVVVVLLFSTTGTLVLLMSGRIHLLPAACLALGQGVGGYLGARLSLGLAERYLLGLYTLLLLGFAAALCM